MIYQTRKTLSSDWWGQRTILDMTRNDCALAILWIAIVAAYIGTDWDRAFGLRHQKQQVVGQQVAKK